VRLWEDNIFSFRLRLGLFSRTHAKLKVGFKLSISMLIPLSDSLWNSSRFSLYSQNVFIFLLQYTIYIGFKKKYKKLCFKLHGVKKIRSRPWPKKMRDNRLGQIGKLYCSPWAGILTSSAGCGGLHRLSFGLCPSFFPVSKLAFSAVTWRSPSLIFMSSFRTPYNVCVLGKLGSLRRMSIFLI